LELQANELLKALQAFDKLPKTFEVTETCISKDMVTEKTRKTTRKNQYRVIRLWTEDEHSITVDFDLLRALARKLKKTILNVQFSSGNVALLVSYPGGDYCLFNLDAIPSAELNLSDLPKG